MNLKNGKVFTSKSVGTGPSSYEKKNLLGRGPVPGPGINYIGPREILLELITNLNVILYLSTCHTVHISVLIVFMNEVKWSRYRPDVAQRVGRGIALLFHDRGTGRRWVVSSTPRSHFTPRKDPAGWAPGPVWTGGKSRTYRDLIKDRPARSQSLYDYAIINY